MAARFMLDTNVMIHIRARRRDVVERFIRLEPGEAVISAITYGELRFGAEKSQNRDFALMLLAQMVEVIPVASLSESASTEYGAIRALLASQGNLIGPNDLWIAAHARSAGLTLITNNEREFRRVPGLAVENWAA